MAVNVSVSQILAPGFERMVAQALADAGLPPELLEIEITESVAMQSPEVVQGRLGDLKRMGVSIAIDDFGTGYSSLSYLQKFPFDKIKIDRSFIEGLSESGETNAIVKAVTSLADSFRMTTTAEGVETQAQREIIQALGCTEMQGYLFSKARTPQEIGPMLAAQGWELDRDAASKPLAAPHQPYHLTAEERPASSVSAHQPDQPISRPGEDMPIAPRLGETR